MNKLRIFYYRSDHRIRDILVPVSLTLFLLCFLVWIIAISIHTKRVEYTPNQTTLTTDDHMKGGDNS